MANSTRGDLKRLFGLVLMIAGAFWITLTGVCNSVFLFQIFGEGDWSNADLVLILGAPSLLIGVIIYFIGRWLGGGSSRAGDRTA